MTTEQINDAENEPPLTECDWCNAIVPEDEVDDCFGVDSEAVCTECQEHAISCEDCGEQHRNRHDMYSVHHGYVCGTCYDSYGTCEYCDSTYHYDDGPSCGCEDERDDYSRYVHDYSYRPSPVFHRLPTEARGTKTLYLGCELEVENYGHDSLDYGAELAHQRSRDEQLYYLKYDGSLSNGFEIVTHPMTLNYIRDEFRFPMCDPLTNIGYRSWDGGSCGFHIHLSRSAFVSRSHVFKFVWFVYANSEPLISFAGRHSTSYARFEPAELQTLTDKANGGSQDTRYYALNTQNSRTIEMRFFRGSLNRETVLSYCEMADALFHYTKTLSINAIANNNGISFRAFADWSKKQDYPALNARIAQRVYPSVEV